MKPFLPKDNQKLPDFYKVKVHYVNGTKEEFKVASQKLIEHVRLPRGEGFEIAVNPAPCVEFYDSEDRIHLIPILSVQRIEYDKAFTDILELKKKRDQERKKA